MMFEQREPADRVVNFNLGNCCDNSSSKEAHYNILMGSNENEDDTVTCSYLSGMADV